MIVFWFGSERVEWVSVWVFGNCHALCMAIFLFGMITNWMNGWRMILFVFHVCSIRLLADVSVMYI
jgi:hypothetical protein